eukprot:866525-Rhodomonas_salina.1
MAEVQATWVQLWTGTRTYRPQKHPSERLFRSERPRFCFWKREMGVLGCGVGSGEQCWVWTRRGVRKHEGEKRERGFQAREGRASGRLSAQLNSSGRVFGRTALRSCDLSLAGHVTERGTESRGRFNSVLGGEGTLRMGERRTVMAAA